MEAHRFWQRLRRGETDRRHTVRRSPADDQRVQALLSDYEELRKLGLAKQAAGDYLEASELLRQAALVFSGSPDAWCELGAALELAGRIEAARAAYRFAYDSDPKHIHANQCLRSLPELPRSRGDFSPGQRLVSDLSGNAWQVEGVREGTFGKVYVCTELETGKRYALKTLKAEYLWSDEDRSRFEREAVTWLILGAHPNIVVAHWVDRIEGFPCLVLEYLPRNLEEVIGTRGVGPRESLRMALQICDGMSWVHRTLCLVHRDLKPLNCLIGPDGVLKIGDFGLARPFGERVRVPIGGAGANVPRSYTLPGGTPPYQAPEQDAWGVKLDCRADIHALGVIFCKLLSGWLPMGGYGENYLPDEVRDFGRHAHWNRRLLDLILACVEPDRAKRPATFDEVRLAIEPLYLKIAGNAVPPAPLPRPAPPAQEQNRAASLIALGLFADAIRVYDAALRLSPRNPELFKGKAAALYSHGDYGSAVACALRGLELMEDDGGLWQNLGLSYRALGRGSESIQSFETACRLLPRDPSILKSLAETLHREGRFAEALNRANSGLAISADDAGLHEIRGLVLIDLDRCREALNDFDAGLDTAPRRPGLWHGMGLARYNLGETDEALRCFARALETGGPNPLLFEHQALALVRAGKPELSADAWSRAITLAPDETRLFEGKCAALYVLGRWEDVFETARRGIQGNKGTPQLHKYMGAALLELGRPAEASDWLGQGVNFAPEDAEMWLYAGMASAALGRLGEAVQHFDRGLGIVPDGERLLKAKAAALAAGDERNGTER